MTSLDLTASTFGPFAAVAFDCDSTLSSIEGIDELARRSGRFDDVEPLTRMAMDGQITIDAVYGRRMDIVRPDRAALDWLAEEYLRTQTVGADEVFETLARNGITTHIISGGLRQAILPLASRLGVPADRVHAVDVVLDAQGGYLNFATAHPLTRASGKAEIMAELIAANGPMAIVGDGVTDMAARAAGATAIGFGGIVARDAVRAAADRFVAGPHLTAVLPFLLAGRPTL